MVLFSKSIMTQTKTARETFVLKKKKKEKTNKNALEENKPERRDHPHTVPVSPEYNLTEQRARPTGSCPKTSDTAGDVLLPPSLSALQRYSN